MYSTEISKTPNRLIPVLATTLSIVSAALLPLSLTQSASEQQHQNTVVDSTDIAVAVETQSESNSPSSNDQPAPIEPKQPSPLTPETPATPAPVTVNEQTVGQTVEGRPITCRTIGSGEYVVLMMASIHGNEAAGTPLLNDLTKYVIAHPDLLDGLTLVLMPKVNPDGVASGKRFNTRGVDLNRNFPAENRKNSSRYGMSALSEPEALAIYQVLNNTIPNHIVTLHQPLQCVDYDGPAKQLAQVMSEHCPLPVEKLGSRPGSLGSYAGVTLGIPTVTFELPQNAASQSPELLWRFYGEALVQALLYRHQSIDTASQQSDSPR